MAITTTLISRADPSPNLAGQTGQPLDSSVYVADIVLGAAADYVNGTGLSLATALTACGCSGFQGAIFQSIRTTAGAYKRALGGSTTLIAVDLDTSGATPQLRMYVAPTIGGTYVEATGATHFVAGDTVRVLFIGV